MEQRIAHDTLHTTALRRLLESRGIKQGWLAEELGVRADLMSDWCRGRQPVPSKYLPLIVSALNQFPKVRQKDIR